LGGDVTPADTAIPLWPVRAARVRRWGRPAHVRMARRRAAAAGCDDGVRRPLRPVPV